MKPPPPFKTSESQRSPMIYIKQRGQDQKTNGAQIVANEGSKLKLKRVK